MLLIFVFPLLVVVNSCVIGVYIGLHRWYSTNIDYLDLIFISPLMIASLTFT